MTRRTLIMLLGGAAFAGAVLLVTIRPSDGARAGRDRSDAAAPPDIISAVDSMAAYAAERELISAALVAGLGECGRTR